MSPFVHLIIGCVLGAVSLWSYNNYLKDEIQQLTAPVPGNSDQKIVYPSKLTKEDIENGIKVHSTLADDRRIRGKTLQLTKVTDGVYVAWNFSFANIVFLEGPEGLIVVDTSESPKTAEVVLQAVREVTEKPIKAIVLTHFHSDHTQGIDAFIENQLDPPDIWSHYSLPDLVKGQSLVARKMYRGGVHQFGFQLSGKSGYVWPQIPRGVTMRFPNRLIVKHIEHAIIAGLNVTFIHLPGETDDHIAVWLEDKRVLVSGDNVYPSFPNIFALRGTPPRNPVTWVTSLRRMRSIGAEYLVPCHGPPVSGRQTIYDLLRVYSSAIQFVHDQSVRRMNEFYHPDEIGRMVRLPPSLASQPYLREFYGMVETAVKSVYNQYMGWFSGDPAELFPLTPAERAQALVDWLGVDRILDQADLALRSGQTQWSLELSGHVRRAHPDNLRARWLWMQSLRSRAAEQRNAPARNYYLTAALDSYELLDFKIDPVALVKDGGLFLELMKYRLKTELTDGVNSTIRVHFTDTGVTYRLQILYSVLEIDVVSSDSEADVSGETVISTDEPVWLDIVLGKLQPASAFSSGQIKVTGNLMDVRQFLSFF